MIHNRLRSAAVFMALASCSCNSTDTRAPDAGSGTATKRSSPIPGATVPDSSAEETDVADSSKQREPDAKPLIVVTPGEKPRRAVEAALAHLSGSGVDVARFTHARASEVNGRWHVVLIEVVDKPRFGGFEYEVTLENTQLRVLDVKKGQ